MELIFTYANKNRVAKVYTDPLTGYVVEYIMNGTIIRKTRHVELQLAESVADDFIAEAGDSPSLLNETA